MFVNATVAQRWLSIYKVCLVADKGPVKLCVFAGLEWGGGSAVPVHNSTGLTCQLWAPLARHKASQQENKGHNE